MGKKRIFEIAKEYGVKSPEVIELLAKHNISKTNFSSVDDSEAAIIHAAFAKKQPAPTKSQKPIPQTAGNAEKTKPAVTPVPPKAKPEKTERPSMIVKPVIMTVETNADGKSTITHNALQKDKTVKPSPAENRPDNRNTAAATAPVPGNDGKNKYRNVPNNKNITRKDTPAAESKQPDRTAVNIQQPNANRNVTQNRSIPNRPANTQGINNRPEQGQNRDFNRQGGGFNRGDRQGQSQGYQAQNRDFNRQGGSLNRNDRPGQGQGQGFNRQGGGFNRTDRPG